MRYPSHKAWKEEKGESNLTFFATGYDATKTMKIQGVALFIAAKTTHSKTLWCFFQLHSRCSLTCLLMTSISSPLSSSKPISATISASRLLGGQVTQVRGVRYRNQVILETFWIKTSTLLLCSKEDWGFIRAYEDSKLPGGKSTLILQVHTTTSWLGCSPVSMVLSLACSSSSSQEQDSWALTVHKVTSPLEVARKVLEMGILLTLISGHPGHLHLISLQKEGNTMPSHLFSPALC